MFKVKVVGTYIARSGVMDKEKIKKDYQVEGNIPRLEAALSVVKNKLLGPALAKKYPDYVTFLTYHIVEILPVDEESRQEMGKNQVMFMDRPALFNFIKENGLKVDTRYYPDLFKLREAVQFAHEDPKGYARHFEIHEPELRLDIEMAQCNPGLYPNTETAQLIGSVALKPPAPTKKAKSALAHEAEQESRLAGLKGDMKRSGELGDPDSGDL